MDGYFDVFWLFKGGLEVSSGIVYWYRSSYGTDFEISAIASHVRVQVPAQ